jgi:hypothetical protein
MGKKPQRHDWPEA